MTLMQAFLCKLYRHKRLANFKVGIYLLTQKKGGYIYIYINYLESVTSRCLMIYMWVRKKNYNKIFINIIFFGDLKW